MSQIWHATVQVASACKLLIESTHPNQVDSISFTRWSAAMSFLARFLARPQASPSRNEARSPPSSVLFWWEKKRTTCLRLDSGRSEAYIRLYPPDPQFLNDTDKWQLEMLLGLTETRTGLPVMGDDRMRQTKPRPIRKIEVVSLEGTEIKL